MISPYALEYACDEQCSAFHHLQIKSLIHRLIYNPKPTCSVSAASPETQLCIDPQLKIVPNKSVNYYCFGEKRQFPASLGKPFYKNGMLVSCFLFI